MSPPLSRLGILPGDVILLEGEGQSLVGVVLMATPSRLRIRWFPDFDGSTSWSLDMQMPPACTLVRGRR